MPVRALTARSTAIVMVPLLLAGTSACAAATAVAAAPQASCSGPAASLRLNGALLGVASARGGSAWAVGWAGSKDLIARWDGKTWKRVPAPSPAYGGASIALDGVAVVSARSAWAVGFDGGSSALILRWDGAGWKQVPSPKLQVGILSSVTAVTPADAWAVGYAGAAPATLILHWNGKAWKRIPSPDPAGRSALAGVAATSPGNAWAVGGAGGFPAARPPSTVILHWNGTTWSRVPSPNPPGDSTLTSVTAISPADAWAVGFTGSVEDNHPRVLILHWDGTAWKQVPTPAIPGGGALNAVSAYSARDIWAVGQTGRITSPKPSTLILHWDGRSWSRLPGSAGALSAVAATSSRSAWAVGISAPDRTSAQHCAAQS